ncbi:hypothetical protein SAMN04488029_0322 [Reichenbachiella faecimaris]|uniref:YD repeat-containing protein n=1 Tax=Reichenbachiella faecimaris TaxID=692418 RepID=A0A1W2G624_REIFA|nr:hypothetical protein [Reichenbachiella faecimaris]SMD31984.1 hypothetical protein SAMN04488029_0322 [Reichenbachiella faecimaris]
MIKALFSPASILRKAVFLFTFVTPYLAQAQLRIDKVTPPSFEASALIKYCDHPVGSKYGIPKIKYPIKTLVNKDLYIPISLTYHSIGIKVEEEATWVGLGWRLNAGGVITRIIRGENDFSVTEETDTQKALGYPFEHIKPCFDDCEENENDEFHQKVCAGEIDSDPDIFFFDIMGMKGKFLMTPDHDPNKAYIEINMIQPRKIQVRFYVKDNYWTATDSRGFSYTFKAREITNSFDNYYDYKLDSHKLHFLEHFNQATTSWYLTEVKSPQGATAQFQYDITESGSSPFASNSTSHKMNINDGDIWDLHYSSYCFPPGIENVQIVSENQHRDVYLKSITNGDYTVAFNKSEQEFQNELKVKKSELAGGKYLTEIPEGYARQQLDEVIVSKSGDVISTSRFFYSYFNEDLFGNDAFLYKRLKLDSLNTQNRTQSKGYKFSYEEDAMLPSKESHARDLWGYYNGEEDLYNITPSDFYNYSQPEKLLQEEGKSKHYSLEYLQAGILKKVDYGNSRTIEFAYDHQEFEEIDDEISSHFSENMKDSNFKEHLNPYLFGGLRIKEIIDTYPTEQIYKDFSYKIEGKETGKLIISHYSHDHNGYGHKTSGNHGVKYSKVRIKTGKLFRGKKF